MKSIVYEGYFDGKVVKKLKTVAHYKGFTIEHYLDTKGKIQSQVMNGKTKEITDYEPPILLAAEGDTIANNEKALKFELDLMFNEPEPKAEVMAREW